MNQIQLQKEAYYKELGIAPGVPTEKGAYVDPENTGVGYNTIITNLGDHGMPEGWVQTPKHNDEQGSTQGTPISWNDLSNPDDPQAGYGYIPNDTTTEETFFSSAKLLITDTTKSLFSELKPDLSTTLICNAAPILPRMKDATLALSVHHAQSSKRETLSDQSVCRAEDDSHSEGYGEELRGRRKHG